MYRLALILMWIFRKKKKKLYESGSSNSVDWFKFNLIMIYWAYVDGIMQGKHTFL